MTPRPDDIVDSNETVQGLLARGYPLDEALTIRAMALYGVYGDRGISDQASEAFAKMRRGEGDAARAVVLALRPEEIP